jgi:exosortase C (VPDSG-CTERM-specific)
VISSPQELEPRTTPVAWSDSRRKLAGFLLLLLTLGTAFVLPLFDLLRFSISSRMYSHVILVPCISAYFLWLNRSALCHGLTSSPAFALAAALPGAALLALYALEWRMLPGLTPSDRLAALMGAFVCFVLAGGFLFLGREFMRTAWFSAGFLVFLVPLPTAVETGLETFLQHASAEMAGLLFHATGIPVLRDGLLFRLPGLTMEVAQECSGINSSLVLFVISLIAGQVFLRSAWRRIALVVFVLPLGIARNAFRIVTLGYLTVEVDPDIIHSALHHQGGPIFFALSLVPFMAVLWWLWRTERTGAEAQKSEAKSQKPSHPDP